MGTPIGLDDLPVPVGNRVVAMTADVLPDVPRVPPALGRVASFAPARRARLGAGAIRAALADDDLRERVGAQVAARPAPEEDDPVGLAARGWLVRPEGWEAQVADAVTRLAAAAAPVADEREIERLRTRVADAEQAAREQRATHRSRVEEYKKENAELRRKLGEARAVARRAREESEASAATAESTRTAADAATAALEKENRRLRAELEVRDAAAARDRREVRVERDEVTLRARLLLDTVLEAAAGLRRELALPAVEGAPADRVEADVAEAGHRTPSSFSAGSRSGALLDQLLAMPRARLVIDGYNVSKTAWSTSSLEAQRLRLLRALAPLVARTGAETTVVFDAAETDHRPPVAAPRGVKVLYSPRGVIADEVISDLVAVEPTGRMVVVVTGDRALGAEVTRQGARVVLAEALLELLALG